MSFSPRASRLLRAIEYYVENNNRYDKVLMPPKIPIKSAGNGSMIGTFRVTENQCNAASTLHGGHISSVIDYFSTYALLLHPRGCVGWTTDMNISFLGFAKEGDNVTVEAKTVKLTKTRGVMECTLVKENGDLIARGITGFSLPSLPVQIMDTLPFDPTIKDE